MKKRYLRKVNKRVGYLLPNGGHATFVGKPTKETIEALNNMVEIAKKTLR